MIYNYNDIIKKYKNNYNLNKAIQNNEIMKIENGLYSDLSNYKRIEVIIKKYKSPIFTMKSAFYFLGISDVIPDRYDIASDRHGTKINEPEIKQYFMDNHILNIGKTTIKHSGIELNIYSKERLLIEVVRYKNMIPRDYYKDIINYYRKCLNCINMQTVLDMLENFPKKDMIHKIIMEEVL